MVKKFLEWLESVTVERRREAGQSCESCCHFIDYRDTEDDPDEVNGYCAQVVDTLGFEKALKVNDYGGGFWTHNKSWCSGWKGGPPFWPTHESATPADAVDPHAASTGNLTTREKSSTAKPKGDAQ